MRIIIGGLAFCVWATVSQAQPIPLRTMVYASGFSLPVAFVQDPADSRIQYVVEQTGRIRVVQSGVVLTTDLLNLTGAITFGGEQGLLGMAFAPDAAVSGPTLRSIARPTPSGGSCGPARITVRIASTRGVSAGISPHSSAHRRMCRRF